MMAAEKMAAKKMAAKKMAAKKMARQNYDLSNSVYTQSKRSIIIRV